MATTIPLLFTSGNWFTTRFIAARLGRPQRTIQHWAKTGFFTRRGCIIVFTAGWKGGRCWIRVPQTRDAILSKITLDFTPTSAHSQGV
jgi:hypothetical protein